MNVNFVPPNNPVLRKIAAAVHVEGIRSQRIEGIIERMFEIAHEHRGIQSVPRLVGLAAPQIGISQRVILVDIGADGTGRFGDLCAFINPKVIRRFGDKEDGHETCFSAGNVWGIVPRWSKVVIEGLDRRGRKVTEEYSGFTARIFQHEIDHLNGHTISCTRVQ